MQRLYRLYQGENLNIAEQIQRRRYQVLIHSCMYYNMNTTVVDDVQYDKWARELEALQKDHPDIASNVDYADCFKNFSACTGFDLPLNDPWVQSKAAWLSTRSIDSISNSIERPARIVHEGKLVNNVSRSANQPRKLFNL